MLFTDSHKKMKKILITGATGVIGHYAVNQLLAKNMESGVRKSNPDKYYDRTLSTAA